MWVRMTQRGRGGREKGRKEETERGREEERNRERPVLDVESNIIHIQAPLGTSKIITCIFLWIFSKMRIFLSSLQNFYEDSISENKIGSYEN